MVRADLLGTVFTECDNCHSETHCNVIDFNDGSYEWDYCDECIKKLEVVYNEP